MKYTVRDLIELFSNYEMDTPIYISDPYREDYHEIKVIKDWRDDNIPDITYERPIYFEI